MMQIEENGHQMGFLRKFMMENAGAAATKRLVEKFGSVKGKDILIFAGLGNNGGDALVMARHLVGYDANVRVTLLGRPENIKTEESKWNWSILEKMPSVRCLPGPSSGYLEGQTKNYFDINNPNWLVFDPTDDPTPDVIIDGILGTGITGEIRRPYSSAIGYINWFKDSYNVFTFAVDVPSGVDPNTGNKKFHVTADMTVTFHRMKVGMPKAKDVCGKIFVEKIGIPPEAEIGVL
jgi:NAD(P)H-hydrate epimerase